MFKNYFKTAFRTLAKNKSYSIINIAGLAVSSAAVILLMLWVWDELSYDKMHAEGDRTYITTAAIGPEQSDVWTVSPATLAVFGKKEIPSIELTARVTYEFDRVVEYEDSRFQEKVVYVDSEFFFMFDFPWVAGNVGQPFPTLNSVIIDQSLAHKYFGDIDPMGKVIEVGDGERFTVSGVIEDMPANSSLQFSVLLPLEQRIQQNPYIATDWRNFDYTTYFRLKETADATMVGKQLAEVHINNNAHEKAVLKDLRYELMPIHKMHLYGFNQRIQQVHIFIIVAFVTLLIACINYVNLVTARAARRGKEVSIRKVIGANRWNLFWQFICESFVLFCISLLIALGIVYLSIPAYNELSGKSMTFSLFDGRLWLLLLGSMVSILSLAGVYPAMMLTRLKPALALKGMMPGFTKNISFRKLLVIVQFACSVVLIISTFVIGKQLSYVRQMELGYDQENVFNIRGYNLVERYDAIKQQLLSKPEITGVTIASAPFNNFLSSTSGIDWEGKPESMSQFLINQLSVDRDFFDVMGMELTMGEGFTGTPADSLHYIINETAVKQMGFEDPIGQNIYYQGQLGTIVGVAKDFHFRDMTKKIAPLIMVMDPERGWSEIYIRTTAKDARSAIAVTEELWDRYNPAYEYKYTFMEENFDEMYREDIRTGTIFNIFAGIAILISCLGLFGLVTYTAETKIKEIGIRKTLGASVSSIVMLISKDFMVLVALSFFISFPIAWWIMNKWLSNYAYSVGIPIWIFILSALIALFIAALTIWFKALRAAKANPIKAIATE